MILYNYMSVDQFIKWCFENKEAIKSLQIVAEEVDEFINDVCEVFEISLDFDEVDIKYIKLALKKVVR